MTGDWGNEPLVAGGAQDWGNEPLSPAPPDRPQAHTTAGGLAASAARGAAPYAAGALAGAALGLPFGGVGAVPGAALGVGAAGLTQLATGLYDKLADSLGWPKTATPQEMTDRVLDAAGIQRPGTGIERTVETTAGGAAGAGGLAAGASALAERIGPGVAQSVASKLAEGPGKQIASGALSGAASQATAEAGGGDLAQTAAGLAAGVLPYGKSIATSAIRVEPTKQAKAAIDAGYVLPPAMISAEPGTVSSLAAGESGKIKLQQNASAKNQPITNRLAARGIGLPENTELSEAAFDRAKLPAAATYQEVEAAVPEVAFDKDFKEAANNLAGKASLVEQYFPSTSRNPAIESLREELRQHENAPTGTVMKYIADLRFHANKNLHAVADAQAHALGLAQREAADLVESQLEKSVQNAPKYYAEKFNDAITAQRESESAVTQANIALTKARADMAVNSNVYAWAQAKGAEMQAQKALEAAEARRAAATQSMEKWRDHLMNAHAANESNQTLLDRFRTARQLFAKIYDLESVTNRTTGEVNARGLARLYQKGKPMTGELKTIAEAAQSFDKAMQVPSMFGHNEDWSALDFFGAAASVLHGHPGLAATIAARPFIRNKMLLSPGYQGAMTSPAPAIPPALAGIIPSGVGISNSQQPGAQ